MLVNKKFAGAAYAVYICFVLIGGAMIYYNKDTIKADLDMSPSAIGRRSTVNETLSTSECLYDTDCNNGACQFANKNVFGIGDNTTVCVCNSNYINFNGGICNYHLYSMLATFLISILIGDCGIDWCFLSAGSGCYICAGIVKGLTCGGIGIWWLVDWIRVLTNTFPDGNGQALGGWY